MQMLPAILPNTPSAAARQGKASEPNTEGVFQNVLNQESSQTVKTEAKLSAKQSEGKTAKHKATDSFSSDEQQSDTPSEEIVNQEAQALLAVAQSLIPPSSSRTQLLEEPEVFAQPVAADTEIVPAQSALQMLNGLSHTDSPSKKSTVNNASQPMAETLQSGKEVTEGTATPMLQAAVESQSVEISKTVVPQTATPVMTGANLPANKPVAAETAAQMENSIRKQAEQTSIAVSEIAVSMADPTNKSAQLIAPAQSGLAPVVPNGQPGVPNPTRKTKTEPLGDSRFTQLLGRQDTTLPGTMAVDKSPTMATDFESLIDGLNPSNLAAEETSPQTATATVLYPTFAKGANPLEGAAIQPEKVVSPAPGIAENTGEDAITTQAAEFATQLVYAENETLVSGNNETATGLSENSAHSAMAGSVSAPVFSPAQAPATHATTLQQNTGFPIPEQEVMAQVIQRSSLRELEGKREITVELNPEDLGQVKLNLVQEKDQMKLHLQAQSSEVRDILEKHLPRLQEALQQQGLRLETIQVSVDAQRNNTQGFFERQQQQQQAQRNPWQQANRSSLRIEEQSLPVQAAMASSAKGLSLRI